MSANAGWARASFWPWMQMPCCSILFAMLCYIVLNSNISVDISTSVFFFFFSFYVNPQH